MNVDNGQNNQQPNDEQPKKTAVVSPLPDQANQSQKTKAQAVPVAIPTEQKTSANQTSQKTSQVAQNPPPQDLPTQNPAAQNLPGLAEKITPKTFAGTGSAFAPPKTKSLTEPSIKSTTPTTTSTTKPTDEPDKAKPKKLKKTGSKKKAPLFLLIGFIILLLSGGGVFYIIQKQREAEVPTAPVSEPKAVEETPCTLQFTVEEVEPLACGLTGCANNDACGSGLECISITDPSDNNNTINICAEPDTAFYDFNGACQAGYTPNDDDANYAACCTIPVLTCGQTGCSIDRPCEEDFNCISILEHSGSDNTISICAEPDTTTFNFSGACQAGYTPNDEDANYTACCSIPDSLTCGQTGCDIYNPCDAGLTCLEVVAADGTTLAVNVCAEPDVVEPEYNFTEACIASYEVDADDDDATTEACCTMPMCSEDATLTLAVADDESAIITATSPIGYTDIEIRIDDGDADTPTAFRDPVITEEEGDYVWTWELEDINAYEIESITFYVDTDPDNLGEGGEACGTYSPDVTPTPTPVPSECGSEGCEADTDCSDDLICIEADDGDNYCSMEEYETACADDPSVATCCTAPTATPTPTSTPEPTPTDEPGATNTPPPASTSTPVPTGPITVDTSINCNDACTDNSDCTNISHICYNGLCRLDVNPEDEYCRTPAGETVVERIVEAPVSGPEDWLNYLKIGIGAIGAGLLMLLFL